MYNYTVIYIFGRERRVMLSLYLSMLANEEDKLNFENLYRKYGKSVLKYANSLLHHRQNAEDTAHGAWLYVAEHFHQFQFLDEVSFKNYMMKIVENQSAGVIRKQTRETEWLADTQPDLEDNASDDEMLLAFCEKEDCLVVIESIKQLDACYRDVLNLFYLNESSPKEIAKMLCLKEATVRKRLSRGRKKLIAILQKKGVNYEMEYE